MSALHRPHQSIREATHTSQYQDTFKRVEKKYLLRREQYIELRRALDGHMVCDRFGLHTVCNVYFDTPDYALIRRSLEKPVYKEKLRMRSYGVPGPGDQVFLEIKKKYKGVVYKRRIALTLEEGARFMRTCALSEEDFRLRSAVEGQIAREINWFERIHCARPRAYIAYDRVALFAPDAPDLRVTFDSAIRWRGDRLWLDSPTQGKSVLPEDRVLMEIKIPGALPLWLSHELTRLGIFPTTFSKYGACYRRFIADKGAALMKGCDYSA